MKVLSRVLILLAIAGVVYLHEGCISGEEEQWAKIMLSYPYECFDPQFLLEMLTCFDAPHNNLTYGEGINECVTKYYALSGVVCRSNCTEMLNELLYMAVRKYDFSCYNQKFLQEWFKCLYDIRKSAECPENGYSSCTTQFKDLAL
uniref:Uncharacterized protein n=2 Tax=Photinus pyralis TaxID=7054 RepID=A0A1Y1L5H7_PHOPY